MLSVIPFNMTKNDYRKLKLVLMLAMLGVSEGRRVASRVFRRGSQSDSSEFNADGGADKGVYSGPKHERLASDPEVTKEVKLAFEQVKAILEDPEFQWRSERFTEHIHAILTVPKVQEEAQHALEQWKSIMENPGFQEKVNHVVEQIYDLATHPKMLLQAKHIAEHEITIMEDQAFLQHAKHAAEHLRAIMQYNGVQENLMDDSWLSGHVKLFEEHVNAMVSHPNLKNYEKLVAEQLKALMEDQDIQQQAELASKNLKAIMQDPLLQQVSKLFTERMHVVMTDAKVQQHAKLASEQLKAVMKEPILQKKLESFVDLMESMMTDSKIEQTMMMAAISGEQTEVTNEESSSLVEVSRKFVPHSNKFMTGRSSPPRSLSRGRSGFRVFNELKALPHRANGEVMSEGVVSDAAPVATPHLAAQRPGSVSALVARTPPLLLSARSNVTFGEQEKENRARLVAGDLVSAVLAALIVTPLTMIVDVAITKAAAGASTLPAALVAGALEFVTNPVAIVKTAAFKLSLFVYVCTYAAANLAEAISKLYLGVSPILPKLVAATAFNMGSSVYKDARLAQLFGSGGNPRPFPVAGLFLFLLRDILANGGGFTFPPMVVPLLEPRFGKRAKTMSQLLVPAAIMPFIVPPHLLALSLYNSPSKTAMGHAAAVASAYVGVTAAKILRGFAAYGLGGVSNTALRAKLGSGKQ